ncbi:MAG: hypothetical protein JSR11_11335 [Bacteroidetes bacterium]|nr:hypothetical protein [Bacteroidota bacterium]
MKFFLLSGMALMSIYAVAQQPKDSLPVSKEKIEFYKNYSEYLIKTKGNKPKNSIDSSVYFPQIKQVVQPTVKSNFPSEEITGTVQSGYKKSVEIAPGKPQKIKKEVAIVQHEEIKPSIVQEVKENQTTVPKQVKFIFDSTKTSVAKITVDSSVYLPKTQQKISPTIKTNLPAEEITGTVKSGYKKSYEILPGKPQKKVDTLLPVKLDNLQQKEISETIQPTTTSANIPFKKFEFKEQPVAKNPSAFVDTTQIKTGMDVEIISTDLESKQIKGTLLPDDKNNLIIPAKHVEQINNTVQQQVTTSANIPFKKFEFKEQPVVKNPSAFVDTTQIKTGMDAEIIGTDLLSKQITGTLLPDDKNNLIIPAKPVEKTITATPNQTNNNNQIKTQTPATPVNVDLKQVSGDYLNTYSLPPAQEKNNNTITDNNNSNYVDPFANYTIPNAKANYKSQYLVQGATLPKTVIEPLSPDSIRNKFIEDSLNHLRVYDSIKNANDQQQQINNTAQQNSYQSNYTNTYQQSSNYNYANNGDASQNITFHFYLTQTGHYSVSFSNNYFYLNVDERGVVKDYGLINNGYITKGIPDGKPIHAGNLYVGYSNNNLINNIAGVDISYAFDGRINKVGNTYINYNYEGVMEKVGSVNITYNSNFSVYRFGPFGIIYDSYGKVLGVDENRGLIIFNK